jgi:hypothetical protein
LGFITQNPNVKMDAGLQSTVTVGWNESEHANIRTPISREEGLATHLCQVFIVCRRYEKKFDFAGPPLGRPVLSEFANRCHPV